MGRRRRHSVREEEKVNEPRAAVGAIGSVCAFMRQPIIDLQARWSSVVADSIAYVRL